MKESIKLVILPLYRIENDYPYYLFSKYRNDSNTLNLAWLEKELVRLDYKFNITSTSIEGGEISKLSDIYFDVLFKLLKTYKLEVKTSTEFINYNPSLINGVDIINVIYNFNNYSAESELVKKNIIAATSIGKIINVESLDISVEDNPLDIISTLNKLNIKSWKILPYHQNLFTSIKFKGYDFFEKIIKQYLKLSNCMQFSFLNKLQLENVINDNNFPINTIYITPNNKYGLINFDKNNNIDLIEYEDLDELEKNLNIQQNQQILLCKDCKYKTNCLAERYFNPNYIGKSCSGFKNLLNFENKGK